MPDATLPRRTLRLVFTYRGREIELVSAISIDMTPPPSDALRPNEQAPGFWYELHDADRRPLYRRITENPIRTSAEVLTEDRDRPIAREPLTEPGGQFVLHAPDLEEARIVVLAGSPPEAEPGVAPAEVLARFELPPPNERRKSP